jgi:hypothetical protein
MVKWEKAGAAPVVEAAEPQEESVELPGGARRSHRAPSYHLLPKAGAVRIALRFELGALHYGDFNWLSSLDTEENAREFARDAYNHMIGHALAMADGSEPDDDHLGAIGWAVYALAEVERKFGKPWTELEAADAEGEAAEAES